MFITQALESSHFHLVLFCSDFSSSFFVQTISLLCGQPPPTFASSSHLPAPPFSSALHPPPWPPSPATEYNARIRGISESMTPQQSDRHRSYSFSGLSTFPRFCFLTLFHFLSCIFRSFLCFPTILIPIMFTSSWIFICFSSCFFPFFHCSSIPSICLLSLCLALLMMAG